MQHGRRLIEHIGPNGAAAASPWPRHPLDPLNRGGTAPAPRKIHRRHGRVQPSTALCRPIACTQVGAAAGSADLRTIPESGEEFPTSGRVFPPRGEHDLTFSTPQTDCSISAQPLLHPRRALDPDRRMLMTSDCSRVGHLGLGCRKCFSTLLRQHLHRTQRSNASVWPETHAKAYWMRSGHRSPGQDLERTVCAALSARSRLSCSPRRHAAERAGPQTRRRK